MFWQTVFIGTIVLLNKVEAAPASNVTTEEKDVEAAALLTPEEVKTYRLGLEYLGNYNGRNYYMDRVAANHVQANSACSSFGLRLVEFGSASEVAWVVANINSRAAVLWVGAWNYDRPIGFQWISGGSVGTLIPFYGFEHSLNDFLGLALSTSRGKLVSKTRGTNLSFICSS